MFGTYSFGSRPFGSFQSVSTGAVSVNATQATITSVTAGAAGQIKTSQVSVIVTYNIPAEEIKTSQTAAAVVYTANNEINVSQASVMAVVKGVVNNPKVRAWYFTLDGHDFYVLKLGTDGKTLVFDLATGQWSWWASNGNSRWRASLGTNWRSAGTIPSTYGSNVIVGDDTFGALWVLDPEKGTDYSLVNGAELAFSRVATGQMVAVSRQTVPVYSVDLRASIGQPAVTTNTVTLEYSDDQGNTFIAASDPIVVESANFAQEYCWRSLGLVRAPGRLFRITDDGSFTRIDNLDVNE